MKKRGQEQMRGFCGVSKVGKINAGLGKYTLITHSELRAGVPKQGKEVAGSYTESQNEKLLDG